MSEAILLENFRNLKMEKFENNIVEVIKEMDELGKILQKIETNLKHFCLLKEEIFINYLNEIFDEKEKKEKITQLKKLTQKTAANLKNGTNKGTSNNNLVAENNSSKILDENSTLILNKIIENFGENFLNFKTKENLDPSSDEEFPKLIREYKIFNAFSRISQNFTEKNIEKIKQKSKSDILLKEKFEVFLSEEIINKNKEINLLIHFTKYLQKSEAELKNKLDKIFKERKSDTLSKAIFMLPILSNSSELLKEKNFNYENSYLIICFFSPLSNKVSYFLNKSEEILILNYFQLKEIGDSEYFKEYLEEYIKSNEDFEFYFDINKFIEDKKPLKFLTEKFNFYFDGKRLTDFSLEEIPNENSLMNKLKEFENEFLYLNEEYLIKGFYSFKKMELFDMQIKNK